jgi:hypothetical protein
MEKSSTTPIFPCRSQSFERKTKRMLANRFPATAAYYLPAELPQRIANILGRLILPLAANKRAQTCSPTSPRANEPKPQSYR